MHLQGFVLTGNDQSRVHQYMGTGGVGKLMRNLDSTREHRQAIVPHGVSLG